MADADDIDEEVGLLKPGDVLDGRYRIEKELGRGGIGVVYRAFDLELQNFVAIKMLLPKWAKDRKMVARFLREGRLVAVEPIAALAGFESHAHREAPVTVPAHGRIDAR